MYINELIISAELINIMQSSQRYDLSEQHLLIADVNAN